MKTLFEFGIGLLCFVAIIIATNTPNYPEDTTDLEIYTLENIYYIDGLTVTNESNDKVLEFETQQELFDFISITTVQDNQAGYDCLMK